MPGGRLDEQERRLIASGLAEGLTYSAIARQLGRPVSTVTREIARNGGPSAYRPDRAHYATRVRARRRKAAPVVEPVVPADSTSYGRDPHAVGSFEGDFARQLVSTGMPRITARVLACLYTTDSGSLTAAELTRRLRVSAASISKAVGYLEQQELIRRERPHRRRADHYRIDDDVWYQTLLASARSTAAIAETTQRGSQTLGPTTPAGARLDDMAHFLRRVSADLVESLDRWQQARSPSTGP